MTQPQQLGFGFDEMLEEQRVAHLPSTMEEAIPFHRKLIERHNEAMLAGDIDKTMAIREEAHDLAVKLNGGTQLGICAPDGPASVLERETTAPAGTIPLWGQEGSFTVDVNGMKVRIEQDGMFGVSMGSMFWPGFSANVVDVDKPFVSDTGYRSFLGIHADPIPGITPDVFAREVLATHIAKELKGKPRQLDKSYAERIRASRVGEHIR